MKLRLLFVLSMFTLIGCDGEEVLKEQVQIQSREQIEAENQNLEEWSKKLQSDLDKRRTFISAIEGEFEGQFNVEALNFAIRIKLSSTIPDYDSDRVKTLSELEYEFQNLNLNIHVVQWNPDSNMSAVGCVIENVKPDLKKGIMNLISENCSNSYALFLAEEDNTTDMTSMGTTVATQVRDGRINYVQMLNGKLQSSSTAKIYQFSLTRI